MWGTPTLVLLPNRLRENMEEADAALGTCFPRSKTFFALKAAYHRVLVEAAVDVGAGLEVMSELELDVSRAVGVDASGLVVNGLGRTKSFVERIIADPPSVCVIDTAEDLAMMQSCLDAQDSGYSQPRIRIALRLQGPEAARSSGSILSAETKFGVGWPDELVAAASAVLADSRLRLSALLVHGVAHCTEPDEFARPLRQLVPAVERLRDMGAPIDTVDIGGGVESRPVLARRELSISDFAIAARQVLDELPLDELTIACEPGRYVASDAGVALTRVVATKPRGAFTWAIIDFSSNTLVPVPGAVFLPLPVQKPRYGEASSAVRVSDRSCANVTICQDAIMAGKPGDLLAILNAGAYTSVFSHVWGPPLPKVVCKLDDGDVREVVSHAQYGRAFEDLTGYSDIRTM